MNKDELKYELGNEERIMIHPDINDHYESFIPASKVYPLIDQLDEPETLSTEWIDDNEVIYPTAHGVDYYVPAKKLYGLIVPKHEEKKESPDALIAKAFQAFGTSIKNSTDRRQAELKLNRLGYVVIEKPVVPKFVADWIEVAKSRHHTLLQAIGEYAPEDIEEWLWKYYNSDLFGKAWSAYPNIEVEKEPNYYVDLETAAYVAKWDGDGSVQIYTDAVSGNDEYELHLTEQEIKDYDERFWPFAVPVEEEEE